MKIFSNFDTRAPLESYKLALAEFGADKVIFVRRDRIYLTFFVVLPSVVVWLILVTAFLIRLNVFNGTFLGLVGNIVFSVIFVIIAIMVLIRIIMNYINYLLDYTIITPHLITSYNQTGLFKRQIRTIDTDKIKAITVSSKSFWQSLFNYWSVVFLSEWDEEDYGDIVLHFLNDPNRLKDEVVRVINLERDD
jgi:uncharacterized membrane protein YdbT with pleckstrin-like domain